MYLLKISYNFFFISVLFSFFETDKNELVVIYRITFKKFETMDLLKIIYKISFLLLPIISFCQSYKLKIMIKPCRN